MWPRPPCGLGLELQGWQGSVARASAVIGGSVRSGGTSARTGRAREARARSVRRSSGCARHRCAALASKARP